MLQFATCVHGFPPIVAFKSSCVIVPLFGVRVAVEIKWRVIIKQAFALNLFFLPVKKKSAEGLKSFINGCRWKMEMFLFVVCYFRQYVSASFLTYLS